MDVIYSENLEDHFMETGDRYFEVEGFVDVAVDGVEVDVLALAETLVDPSIADRL